MIKKFSYIIVIIVTLFIGVSGTLIVLHYFPINNSEGVIKSVKEVSITETNTIKEAVDKIYNSVVLIETANNGRSLGSGTGFVYRKSDTLGYIITNHHVIENANEINVTNINGETVSATLLGSDEYSDIAVLSVDVKSVLAVAYIGSSADLEIGDTLFTVGSPLGKDYMGTVTKGILSGKDRLVTVSTTSNSAMMEVLQTDAAINPGNSGGPLVNVNGEVIGVNSIKLIQNEIEGMGFAIPIELVMSGVDKLELGEKIVRPLFGVELLDISNTYYLYRNHITVDDKIKNGVVVATVSNDSPASVLGLEKGDVIVSIDGTQIDDVAHFRFVLYKYNVGDKVKVKYYHNKEYKEAEVELNKSAE